MESTGIPHGVHETLFEASTSPCRLHGDSTWTLHGVHVGHCLKSMESPQSPHGACGNMWGSVKYSVLGRKTMKTSGLQMVNQTDIPTSTFDFIDSSNFFNNSGDLSDDCESILDLEDITDSSDNEEDDVPSLKSVSVALKMRMTYTTIIKSQKNQQTSRRGMI